MFARSVLLLHAVNWIAESTLAVELSQNDVRPTVNISKCCDLDEVIVDDVCTLLTVLTEFNESKWQPEFLSKAGKPVVNYEPRFKPICKSNEHFWNVYDYNDEIRADHLVFLPNGMLRHYAKDQQKDVKTHVSSEMMNFDDDDYGEGHIQHVDYPFGHYCIDKAVIKTGSGHQSATYARVCVPNNVVPWTNTDYLMRHAIDPAFHAVSMACYLIVAVIYFVLPQLRDLVGNIITSMMLCLIVNQCASTVRIFIEFSSHVSFMIAGTWFSLGTCYSSRD